MKEKKLDIQEHKKITNSDTKKMASQKSDTKDGSK